MNRKQAVTEFKRTAFQRREDAIVDEAIAKSGGDGNKAVRLVKRAMRREMEREAALRFLRRAVREAGKAQAEADRCGVCTKGVTWLQRDRLWRVVVASSHRSGRFER